jgi:hypothetical protein
MKIYSVSHYCTVTYPLLVEAENEDEALERASDYIASRDWHLSDDVPNGDDHTAVFAEEFTPEPGTKIDIPASWSDDEEEVSPAASSIP